MQEALEEWGAEIDEDGVATTFGNDEKALQAAQNGVAVRPPCPHLTHVELLVDQGWQRAGSMQAAQNGVAVRPPRRNLRSPG